MQLAWQRLFNRLDIGSFTWGIVLILRGAAADRPLQHINKKGRPVSQCQHCRSMRKYRASHVKCDCGEKTSKCIHLQVTVEGHKGEHPVFAVPG